ncbi:MAG TPA: FAD-binding oxidoreductase [Candidatus Hydrogenedentes bacterium]|nr:FAD-binding oxidoreductase [Candidatus Hydrogenedentota bacterium]HPG68198.1 FAD-binding oxidoreductase [Candidatus Hydrogenedentota bacterium]
MGIERTRLRWNGWGWIDAPDVLGDKAAAVWDWMGKTMGLDPLPNTPPTPLDGIALPEIRISGAVQDALTRMLDRQRVKTDAFERGLHARGRSYHDALWLRAGRIASAPDAVVYPETAEETLAVLELAAEHNVAIVPFGGGSSVVGGVTAECAPGQAGVITVDTTRMDKVIEVDRHALVARVQAGIYGPALEKALQSEGVTLGHYPQSFEFSTLGGWIAPRSAGHQSNKYGTAEQWLVSARLATLQGLWSTEGFPGSAAGPQLRDVVAGSEGTLGIITDAEIKIHPVPEVKDYRGFVFPDFEQAVEALRELMQSGVPNAMVRLSDKSETFFLNAVDTGGGGEGPAQFCLMLVGIEGDKTTVEYGLARTKDILKARGGIHMGESLGEHWYKGRFETPYLRDPMMDRGVGVDTLETCARWSNVLAVQQAGVTAIVNALSANAAASGARGIVMSHLSHSYVDGSSLYFTFAFPRALDREVDQWLAVKRAASDAIVSAGGTISHHHGVGTDHLPWLAPEKGPVGMTALRAIKRQLDPAGILNPGKLL